MKLAIMIVALTGCNFAPPADWEYGHWQVFTPRGAEVPADLTRALDCFDRIAGRKWQGAMITYTPSGVSCEGTINRSGAGCLPYWQLDAVQVVGAQRVEETATIHELVHVLYMPIGGPAFNHPQAFLDLEDRFAECDVSIEQ